MRVVTIIQARMGSTRLPGKVMKDLGGDTVLARVVHRVRRAKLSGEVIIATTTKPADDLIVKECERLSVSCFRGEETDVLDRYYRAAEAAGRRDSGGALVSSSSYRSPKRSRRRSMTVGRPKRFDRWPSGQSCWMTVFEK